MKDWKWVEKYIDIDKVISKSDSFWNHFAKAPSFCLVIQTTLWVPFECLKTEMCKEKYLFLQQIKSVWITTFRDQVLSSWSMSAVYCQWGKSTRNSSIFKIRGYIIEDIYCLKVDSSVDHHFSSVSLSWQ